PAVAFTILVSWGCDPGDSGADGGTDGGAIPNAALTADLAPAGDAPSGAGALDKVRTYVFHELTTGQMIGAPG
ncbi:MAG TPA: hypothetical protein VFK43_17340, partial [Acidimicrobiales bacterium]|nr:hypothetical protein [Acidimicrobiales bacterium]